MFYKIKSVLNNFFSSQLFITIIGLCVFFVILFPLIKNLKQRQRIDNEINSLKNEISASESKNNQLRGILDYIESDQFVEEQARLNLGLRKNGERVAVVADANTGVANKNDFTAENAYYVTESKAPDIVKIKSSNFKNWWSYFFNN